MDRTSNEADETIRYLYRLDELDEILAMNMNILTEIQNAEGGSTGTRGSLSNLRSRQKKVRDHIASLETSLDKGTQRKTTENELPSLTQCTA